MQSVRCLTQTEKGGLPFFLDSLRGSKHFKIASASGTGIGSFINTFSKPFKVAELNKPASYPSFTNFSAYLSPSPSRKPFNCLFIASMFFSESFISFLFECDEKTKRVIQGIGCARSEDKAKTPDNSAHVRWDTRILSRCALCAVCFCTFVNMRRSFFD